MFACCERDNTDLDLLCFLRLLLWNVVLSKIIRFIPQFRMEKKFICNGWIKLFRLLAYYILMFYTSNIALTVFFFFQALLKETERLVEDKLDLQRQSEKDQSSLMQRLRALERDLEEQETKGLEMEHHHKSHTEDLNQRVQALEKQLKHDRQFIEVKFEFKIT